MQEKIPVIVTCIHSQEGIIVVCEVAIVVKLMKGTPDSKVHGSKMGQVTHEVFRDLQ